MYVVVERYNDADDMTINFVKDNEVKNKIKSWLMKLFDENIKEEELSEDEIDVGVDLILSNFNNKEKATKWYSWSYDDNYKVKLDLKDQIKDTYLNIIFNLHERIVNFNGREIKIEIYEDHYLTFEKVPEN